MAENSLTPEQDLLKLKGVIDQAKTEKAQAEGSLKTLWGQLKQEFGCQDLKTARAKLADMDRKIAEDEKKLADGLAALKEKYEW